MRARSAAVAGASRRVLVVAYYFPPVGGGGVNRTVAVVKGLCAAGFTPVVLTVDDAAWPRDATLLPEIPNRVRVMRIPNPDWGRVTRGRRRRSRGPGGAGGSRLRRWLVPDLHVGWSALATPVAATLALTRSIDLVYSTCPPYSAHAPAWIARQLGVPWIADFRDGWTCCPTRADLPPRRIAFERRLEARVLHDADRVVFASEAVRARALRRTPGLADRSETVLTGYDRRRFADDGQAVAPGQPFEIVHAGTVCSARRDATLEHWLDALGQWADSDATVPDGVRMRFIGAEPEVGDAIRRAGLEAWVRLEPAVPRTRLARRLRASHLCLALAPPGKRGGDPIPGKLFDAAGAGRPLLALTGPGALGALIEQRGLGVAHAPEARETLVELLRSARKRVAGHEPALPFDAAGARMLEGGRSVARIVELCESLLPTPSVSCPSPAGS